MALNKNNFTNRPLGPPGPACSPVSFRRLQSGEPRPLEKWRGSRGRQAKPAKFLRIQDEPRKVLPLLGSGLLSYMIVSVVCSYENSGWDALMDEIRGNGIASVRNYTEKTLFSQVLTPFGENNPVDVSELRFLCPIHWTEKYVNQVSPNPIWRGGVGGRGGRAVLIEQVNSVNLLNPRLQTQRIWGRGSQGAGLLGGGGESS